jgi:Flp pilus assembly protein TadG
VTVIEFVLLTPVLFLIMFGTIEFGLVVYARHVAVAAAQEGARTAREEAYSQPQWGKVAKAAAVNWVGSLAGGLVDGQVQPGLLGPASVKGVVYPEVGVSVSFSVVTMVPWTFTVRAQSEGPVECFYTPQGKCNGG